MGLTSRTRLNSRLQLSLGFEIHAARNRRISVLPTEATMERSQTAQTSISPTGKASADVLMEMEEMLSELQAELAAFGETRSMTLDILRDLIEETRPAKRVCTSRDEFSS